MSNLDTFCDRVEEKARAHGKTLVSVNYVSTNLKGVKLHQIEQEMKRRGYSVDGDNEGRAIQIKLKK